MSRPNTSSTRNDLFSKQSNAQAASTSTSRNPYETDETRNYDNEDLQQQQQRTLDDQDDRLDDILNGVTRLKIMSTDINSELQLHHHLIGELDDQIDRTDNRIKSSTRSVVDISTRDADGWCTFCTMVLLLVLIVLLASTNWFCFVLNINRCWCWWGTESNRVDWRQQWRSLDKAKQWLHNSTANMREMMRWDESTKQPEDTRWRDTVNYSTSLYASDKHPPKQQWTLYNRILHNVLNDEEIQI